MVGGFPPEVGYHSSCLQVRMPCLTVLASIKELIYTAIVKGNEAYDLEF